MSDTGSTPPTPPQPAPQPGDGKTRAQPTEQTAPARTIRDVPVEKAPERLIPRQAETRAENRAERTTRVEARVVSQKPDGTTHLRTANAEDIVIRTQTKLAEGRRVILQLRIAKEQAAQQAQIKPSPNQPQQAQPRPVAMADITLPRSTATQQTAQSTAQQAAQQAAQQVAQQIARLVVQQGAQIRAQYIPPLQTALTQQPVQVQAQAQNTAAQQAPPAQVSQAPLQQSPLQNLQQQVAQLLARSELPLLPPGGAQATGQPPAITPPGPAALQSLNALPATLKPLLVLLAAQADTPGISNVPLQQVLSRPGLPALNITQLPPQAALPLLTGPGALFQLGQELAASRPNAPAPALPSTPGQSGQPLQTLLQQLGIIQTGAQQPGAAQQHPPLPLAQSASGAAQTQNTSLKIAQVITPQNIPDNPALLRSMLSQGSPQGPQLITGVVTGPDRAGNPVVATARGQFILSNAQPLPAGTVLSFSITPDAAAMAQKPDIPLWPLPPLDPLGTDRWGAMEEAIRALQADNTAAAQALRNVIPAPVAARFTTATLFFLAALRAGDIGAWMGQQQIQALRDAGRTDLINRLNADFGRAATQSADVLPGDWRAIPLPFIHEEQVMKIQMFMRQQRGKGDKDKDGKGKAGRQTRFLIEAMLSRLGAMQLDGLFTPADKRLDLVMRTKEPLPGGIRTGMAQRYNDTISATGMAGEIKFQGRGKGWVHIDADGRHNGHIGVNA